MDSLPEVLLDKVLQAVSRKSCYNFAVVSSSWASRWDTVQTSLEVPPSIASSEGDLLIQVSRFTSLTSLRLHSSPTRVLTDFSVGAVCVSFRRLTSLDLAGEAALTERGISSVLSLLPHLRSLTLKLPLCRLPGSSNLRLTTSLHSLQLSHVAYPPGFSLTFLSQLRKLHLGVSRQDFPPGLGSLTSLRELSLSSPQCRVFPPELQFLTGLRSLELRCLFLTDLSDSLTHLQSLTSLVVLSDVLLSLPAGITRLQRLKSLDISWTSLQDLPPYFSRLSQLHSLDVSATALQNVPGPVLSMTGLTKLGTSMSVSDVSRLENLRELHVVETGGEEVLCSLPALLSLHCVNIASYQVALLPTFTSLQSLQLESFNEEGLPDSITQLPCLRKLSLVNCSMHHLPETLGHLSALRELELLGVKYLEALPESTGRLSLRRLVVTQARLLSFLPRSLSCLREMDEISVDTMGGWSVSLMGSPFVKESEIDRMLESFESFIS